MPKSGQKTGKGAELDSSQTNSSSRERSSSQVVNQSQTLTQAEKSLSSFDSAEVNRRVNELVTYLLIMDQKKLPIKKQDINKTVLKEFSKAAPLLIERAKTALLDNFGFNLVELEDKHKGSYIIVNAIETDSENPHLEWNSEDNAKSGLLITILSVIFMGGNVITDKDLWHALKELGVKPEGSHEVFGDVKRLVTLEFVQKGYLEFNKLPNTDPQIYEVKWGWRAKQETSKRNVLDFVSQIYHMDPNEFATQWQDMIETEGPDSEDNNGS